MRGLPVEVAVAVAVAVAAGLGGCAPASTTSDSTLIAHAPSPGCGGRFDDPLDEYAYVVDADGGVVVPHNPRSCTVGEAIPVGSHPVTAAVTGSGQWIYVGDDVDHTITVIRQSTNAVEVVIPLPFAPDELLFEPAHTVLWAAERATGAAVLIESEHHTIVGEVSLAPGFSSLSTTDALPQTMLASHPDGYVEVIELATRTALTRIDLGGPPLAVHHASNTSDGWACVGGDDPALVVFPSTGPAAFVVTTRIPLDAPCTALRFDGFRYGVALQPALDQVSIVDTETDAVAAEVPVGSDPDVVVTNADVAAIGNAGSGDVSLVSLGSFAEYARPAIGAPGAAASGRRLQDGLDPSFVYAFDPADASLTVIDLRDGSTRPPTDAGDVAAMVVAGPKGGKCH